MTISIISYGCVIIKVCKFSLIIPIYTIYYLANIIQVCSVFRCVLCQITLSICPSADPRHPNAQQRGAERNTEEGQDRARAEGGQGGTGRPADGHQDHGHADRALQERHQQTGTATERAKG